MGGGVALSGTSYSELIKLIELLLLLGLIVVLKALRLAYVLRSIRKNYSSAHVSDAAAFNRPAVFATLGEPVPVAGVGATVDFTVVRPGR